MGKRRVQRAVRATAAALTLCWCASAAAMWTGANVKTSPAVPWGSDAALQSLQQLAKAGAEHALLVAFAWQPDVSSNTPALGSDSDPERVRAGLRQMRQAGLSPILKVHVWIPNHWAGDAKPTDIDQWFTAYQAALIPLLDIAEQEHASAVVLGTELRQLEHSAHWPALATLARQHYSGKLAYVTDSLAQAEAFPWWSSFDIIGTSLYPSLPEDRQQRQTTMDNAAQRLAVLGQRQQRPVWAAEIGLRSCTTSLSKPWESPEQCSGHVAEHLQFDVLRQWQDTLAAHGIDGMAIWCWYTDPNVGGEQDSDFTVQGKDAERLFKASSP